LGDGLSSHAATIIAAISVPPPPLSSICSGQKTFLAQAAAVSPPIAQILIVPHASTGVYTTAGI
jgi:hypothetical protein